MIFSFLKLERYKILDNHFNIKNDENRSNKDLLRQVQKINEQLEKQAKQVRYSLY
jgi:hypothetical protein